MDWTKDKPTVQGWWWFRTAPGTEEVCRVGVYLVGAEQKLMVYFTDGERNHLDELTEGEWRGPIVA